MAEDRVANAKTSTEAVDDTQVYDGFREKLTRISNFHN